MSSTAETRTASLGKTSISAATEIGRTPLTEPLSVGALAPALAGAINDSVGWNEQRSATVDLKVVNLVGKNLSTINARGKQD